MRFEEHIRRQWEDPEYREAFQELAPNLEIAAQVVAIRSTLGMSQGKLAEEVGTKQASISRLENSLSNPRLDFLKRVANALGTRLSIRFEREALFGPEDVFGVSVWQMASWPPEVHATVEFKDIEFWDVPQALPFQLTFAYEAER